MPQRIGKYWAIRFGDNPNYRVTSRRFSNSEAASISLWGIPLAESMRCASFNKAWRSLTTAEKLTIERELGFA